MGEVKGFKMKQMRPGEQIQVNVKDAIPKACDCGCKYFIPVVQVYKVSALMSPTGQELTAQQPVLVCMDCKKPLE
jgi:hypothetical protein